MGKNWVFFNYKNNLNIIYKWFPIYICKIDYNKNLLILIQVIHNLPPIFQKFRGSTNGIEYDNKFWFIVHTQDRLNDDVNYYHYFVIFDKNMKLLGYSNSFKFENYCVEFCIGMVIDYDNHFVITYSTLDSTTKIAIFSAEYINSLIHYI